ncbi:hypothetical protein TNCV_3304861 [Trichonephila clavipes]|nr:hypothetical protein TNCV_3304861 [Trichonephila clavipes]
MRSTKDQLVKKDVLMPDGTDKDQDSKINYSVHPTVLSSSQNHAMPVKHNSLSVPSFLYVSDSPLVSMKKEKRKTYRCGQRTVRLAGCGIQKSSLRAQAQQIQTKTCGLLREKSRD